MPSHQRKPTGPSPSINGRSFLQGIYAAGTLASLGCLVALVGYGCSHSPTMSAGGILLLIALLFGLALPQLSDYRFTFWILIANIAALLAPQWFKSIGGFRLNDPWLLLIMVQLIMFGMGTQMSMRDFVHVLKFPSAVAIGVGCQFLIMPLLGFALAMTFPLPPEIAAGLILIGSCSSGLASNVMTFMARGNLALSVTLTSLTTLLAPIVTPLWMGLLAGSMVQVDALKMSLDIVKMVLVPILAAFIQEFLSSKDRRVRYGAWIFFALSTGWLLWLSAGDGWLWMVSQGDDPSDAKWLSCLSIPGFFAAAGVFGTVYFGLSRFLSGLDRWMPKLSMFGIIFYTLVATAEGQQQLMEVGVLLMVAVLLHNLGGLCLGYWASRLLGLSRNDARTVAIEVGLQNGAMATGLARSMDKLGTTGLAAIIFAPLMNITGSLLANFWRGRPLESE